MINTSSEDTLIFIGLTPDKTDIALIYRNIKKFCNKKKKIDPSDRFNLILFQENGPNYLEEFTLYPKFVLLALKSLESTIVRANIAEGIFLAITFVIKVFKRISEKLFRLIILTDQGSIKIPKRYMPVLEDLIEKTPLIIDVIQINIDDSTDDLKLKELSRKTNGKFYKINKIRKVTAIMNDLAEKKEFYSNLSQEKIKREILDKNFLFYKNLADDLLKVEKMKTCSICFQKDKNLVQCPMCEIMAHESCWAQWAKVSNIGISHLFRCHNCFNLIKLDDKFVDLVNSGKIILEEGIKVEVIDVQQWLEKLEADDGPKIIQVVDPVVILQDEYDDITIKIEDERDM